MSKEKSDTDAHVESYVWNSATKINTESQFQVKKLELAATTSLAICNFLANQLSASYENICITPSQKWRQQGGPHRVAKYHACTRRRQRWQRFCSGLGWRGGEKDINAL